jgi:hypothetical protein
MDHKILKRIAVIRVSRVSVAVAEVRDGQRVKGVKGHFMIRGVN